MNATVLVVATVFVVAGLVLIVLSFLVGRSRPSKEAPEAAEATASSSADVDTSAFIDEPLATDLGQELEGRKKQPAAEESVSLIEKPGSTEPGETSKSLEAPPAESAAAESEAPAPGAASQAPEPTSVANQVGFNFRVQLGFKFLQNGLYQDGVAEFQKALSLTEDREAKLKLYVEIGNAFRAQRMFGPAGAAYLQATSYTDNGMLLEHLERTIAEMMDTDKVGAADSASGSEKEE